MWLESGWAIDARLGRVTREHEDIDVAFAGDKRREFEELLRDSGYSRKEDTDYGFLIRKKDILLDAEPCFWTSSEYNFQGFPAGSCPIEKEGCLDGQAIRCLSWDAIYFEYLGYKEGIPISRWRPKDIVGFRITEENLTTAQIEHLTQLYGGKRT